MQQLRSQAPSSTVFHDKVSPVFDIEYVVVGGASFVKTNAQPPTSYQYTSSIIDIHHYSLVVSHIVVSISIAQPSFWPLESTSLTFDAGYLALGQEIVQLESAIARPIMDYPSSM